MELGSCDSRPDETSREEFAAHLENRGCEAESPESGSANTKAGKNGRNGGAKIGHSCLNSVKKSASQIRKTPHRRSASPLNWFPRRKADSFLKRKIKLLQETEGMNSSLDETLGNANPHYTRIAREKIAAREAAKKAMEARKAAMIEASWCRILHAARIHSKEAQDKLEKAEKHVAEAFEAAAVMGVMMYDRPNNPRRSCEIETSSGTEGASTHKVTASFETAFEVDKEVAAAVKKAFIRLANCPSSSNKEEFRELLRKISQNPDVAQIEGLPDVSLQHESVFGSELGPELHTAGLSYNDAINKRERGMKQSHNDWLHPSDSVRSFESSRDLADMMFDRLKCLSEDEVASLALIVATCGLSAALLEMEMNKNNNLTTDRTLDRTKSSSGLEARRYSSVSSFVHGKEHVAELPSLDKFLVKHVTRLEKEVLEARNAQKISEATDSVKQISENVGACSDNASSSSDTIPDLGSILVKHVSRLERDINAAKNSMKIKAFVENGDHQDRSSIQFSESGNFSHLNETEEVDREKQSEEESRQQKNLQYEVFGDSEQPSAELGKTELISFLERKHVDKENIDLNKPPPGASGKASERTSVDIQNTNDQAMHTTCSRSSTVKHVSLGERAKLETMKAFSAQDLQGKGEIWEQIGLDKILIKPVHRLEGEKMKALERADHAMHGSLKHSGTKIMAAESLDKVLVKHVSRLEKEKMAALMKEELPVIVRKRDQQLGACVESLDQILVKHQSKLEKAKLAAAQDQILPVIVKEKMNQQIDKCTESLDQILVKHQSRLEKAKLAAVQHQMLPMTVKGKMDQQLQTCAESLDQILVKHQSKLERAKLSAAKESKDHVKPANSWRQARERELLKAWGGLSLGNSIKPHLSRLEREKAAWKRAEEEELRRATEL